MKRTFLPLEAFSWTLQRLPGCPSPTTRILASPPSFFPQPRTQQQASSLLPGLLTPQGSPHGQHPHLVLSKGSGVLPPASLGRGPHSPLLWHSSSLRPGVILPAGWDSGPPWASGFSGTSRAPARVSPASGNTLQSSPVQSCEGHLTKFGLQRRNAESEAELTKGNSSLQRHVFVLLHPKVPPEATLSGIQVRTRHGPCPRVLELMTPKDIICHKALLPSHFFAYFPRE